MVSLRGRSLSSLQRRISHPASPTSPAAITSNACDPYAILSLPRARVRLHHTSSAPPVQLGSTLRPMQHATASLPPVNTLSLKAVACQHGAFRAPCQPCGQLEFAWAKGGVGVVVSMAASG